MFIRIPRQTPTLPLSGRSGVALSCRHAILRSHSSSALPHEQQPQLPLPKQRPAESSIDASEVSKFAQASAEWWDPRGQFEMLHRMNPVRVRYIRDQVVRASPGSASATREELARMVKPFSGLSILDIGCGGGLLSESLARLGANVVGVDAAPENIAIATLHSRTDPMLQKPTYMASTAEAILEKGGEAQFDIVCSLEVVEHVRDPKKFIQTCMHLVKPGGLGVFSTINRTPASYLLTVVMAEQVLRWVPAGTHDHAKYVTPQEMVAYIESAGGRVEDMSGIAFDPLLKKWHLTGSASPSGISWQPSLWMNYIVACTRPIN
ncbi:S-adenosyl-L-methionine-dependent methyltransferase [Zopfochytrium polystomum]|nr:S-adenosyl-L-methionine-dependent methyltransferase [Zopfochytrium polystomum]